eukprot:TRINITY_DN2649_c0_g3_i2.p1 TRINITY_DN2649_c0_g3~~TRINITY_DN2649_c0_g3_i2.p1  ORF type:complete len:922 (-),score=255.79 TRINITY_DN2649_c0_g3_i2:370-3036(-)
MAAVEPPTKKAKIDETAPSAAPEEQEKDASAVKGPQLKEKVTFHVEDTTMNVMNSTTSCTLMPLTDGGLQYLFAGVRASAGIKSGRYVFEVKVLEVMAPLQDPSAPQRVPQPRSQVRVGFSTASSHLFLGEGEESVCFDSEGFFTSEKKKMQASQKFATGDIVSVLLNLEPDSVNANTISLFKNGIRVAQPQPLPDSLKGQALYPAITFKNMTLHYNFGPTQLAPLPFKCHMLQAASQKDVVAKAPLPQPKDGKFEVLFPVALPDQGGFDWLDDFLSKNPQYIELSDRALVRWCELSGIFRPKGYAAASRSSNDKPEMGFGIAALDDLSVRRVLQIAAPIQKRHYVVMEVRGSLLQEMRKELIAPWSSFRRIASVVMGEPPASVKQQGQKLMLEQKQEASDLEFRAKQAHEKTKKELEKKQKQKELEKQAAFKKQQKLQEQMKKRQEFEKKKKEALAKGEPAPEEEKVEEEPVEVPQFGEPEPETMDEEPPKVELSDEEKKAWFWKNPVPDLAAYLLNTSFQKFSLPEKSEGYDEIKYVWQTEAKSKQHFKEYVQHRKLTSRVEDLQPSDWFTAKWKTWQKTLQTYHAKQNSYKAEQERKAAAQAAREAKAKAREAAKAKGEDVPMEEAAEEPADTSAKADFENLDVFGVEDVMDIGGSEPLFSVFQFEDWTLMSLRFELHLLAYAFRRDVDDPDRPSIHLEHLPFYYHKYFKKALNNKFYGVESCEELVRLVRDTVVLCPKKKVLEPLLEEDLEVPNIFVMLTEEARRDRCRKIDMGDESAKLKVALPGQAVLQSLTQTGNAAPATATPVRPATPMANAAPMMAPMKMPGMVQMQQPSQAQQMQMMQMQMQQQEAAAWNQMQMQQQGGWGWGNQGMGGFGKGWGKGW